MKTKLLTPLPLRQKTLAFLCLLLAIVVFPGYKVKAQTSGYTWKNAPIGGGGFVTGIVTHKTSGERYCRTDVGGAYRWDAANNRWVQLLDWVNESELGFTAVCAFVNIAAAGAGNAYVNGLTRSVHNTA